MSIIFIQPHERKLITVNVLYFRPDYCHILQNFTWQTEDVVPKLPRIHSFLQYWKDHIEAIISEVTIMESNKGWRKIDMEGTIN